jgi:predicted ATP-dependent serine protease
MLAAEAGAGKTHFAVNIAINYAKQGKSVCYLTLEDGWKMVVDRFGSMDTDMVCHDNVFMVHEDELTMQNASAVIKRASEDASLIIVDNLFALPLRQNAKGDYWQSQAEWVDDICNIIRSTRSSALILHHLNKTPNGTIPGRFQIAGSTRLINRVAQAWLLCRNDSEPETIAIKVEKNRRSMYKGECFLKSASHGKLYGIDEKHVNPKLVSYAKDVFKVDR